MLLFFLFAITTPLTAAASTFRPYYHLTALAGWINDPNGLSYFNGSYHFFFQHNPDDIVAGNIHWGHATSPDLLHWTHHQEALAPDDPYDNEGCFSGSAVVADGKLALVYTGNNDGRGDFASQSQCVAFSEDGVAFRKVEGNPVIRAPPEGGTEDFRDPKVWRNGRFFYVILGNRVGDFGRVVVYKSVDLIDWEYQGVLAQSDGTLGYMWECPDFFELDGRHILIINPQGIEASGDDYQNLHQTLYTVGSYDYDTNTFEHGGFYEVDHGTDFYATQSFEAPDGRRLMVAWMDMWGEEFPEASEGWAGVLTFPRRLSLNGDGRLIQRPAEEIFQLRGDTLGEYDGSEVDGKMFVGDVEAAAVLLDIDMDTSAYDIGIQLDDGLDVLLKAYYSEGLKKFVVVRGDVYRQTSLEIDGTMKLDVFIDKSSVEIFVQDGFLTFTSRVYPKETPKLYLLSSGGKTRFSGEAFSLKNANEVTKK